MSANIYINIHLETQCSVCEKYAALRLAKQWTFLLSQKHNAMIEQTNSIHLVLPMEGKPQLLRLETPTGGVQNTKF